MQCETCVKPTCLTLKVACFSPTLKLLVIEIVVGGAEVIVALARSTTEGLNRMIPPPRTGSSAASSVGLRDCPAGGVGDGAAAGCGAKMCTWFYHDLTTFLRVLIGENLLIRNLNHSSTSVIYLEQLAETDLQCWF